MEKKRSILRSPGILLVALVVLIAATGLVYAHWTTTLQVDANVNTGGVYAEWQGAYTNDDGEGNGDGELTDFEVWDEAWGDSSSADPRVGGFHATANLDNRYDKDVARCTASGGGDTLYIDVQSAYPSYHCSIQGDIANKGNIPLRVTAINASADPVNHCGFWEGTDDPYEGPIGWDDVGPFADFNGNGVLEETGVDVPEYRVVDACREASLDFEPVGAEGQFELQVYGVPHIEGDIALGLRCGLQIDPLACWWMFPFMNDNDTPDNPDDDYEDVVQWDDVGQCDDNDPDSGTCAFDWVTNDNDTPDNTDDDFDERINIGPVYEECAETEHSAEGWFHVMQDAAQNSQYRWTLQQEFVNWNEWSASMCTIGSVVVDPTGQTIIGIANGTDTPTPIQ